jgi:hypothetical protein
MNSSFSEKVENNMIPKVSNLQVARSPFRQQLRQQQIGKQEQTL